MFNNNHSFCMSWELFLSFDQNFGRSVLCYPLCTFKFIRYVAFIKIQRNLHHSEFNFIFLAVRRGNPKDCHTKGTQSIVCTEVSKKTPSRAGQSHSGNNRCTKSVPFTLRPNLHDSRNLLIVSGREGCVAYRE